ncbi:MAG: PEP-utilizing enzyme [Patescibacteria group bacterium]
MLKDKARINLDIKFIADKTSGISCEPFLASIPLKVVEANNYRHLIKFPFYGLSINCRQKYADEYIDEAKYEGETNKLLVYVRKNGPKYIQDIATLITQEAKDFKKYSDKLIAKIPKLSNRQLVDQMTSYVNHYAYHFGLGGPTFVYEAILSARITESLFFRYQEAPQIINQLLAGKHQSFMVDSEKLLLKIKQEKSKRQKDALIKKYIKEFYYMGPAYIYTKPLNASRVLKLAATAMASKHQSFEKIKGFKLLPEEKLIIDILKPTEIIRDKRKYINHIGSYTLSRFLDEAVKRSGVPMSLAVKSFWFEYSDLVFSPQIIRRKLQKRSKVSLVAVDNNLMYLEGDRIKNRLPVNKGQRSFIGISACQGKTTGKVRVILGPSDFRKFKIGEILVTDMTRPDFMPIIRHARAIITNEGGLTSHAAVISRELNIPCVLGTKVATRILKDGDFVEVDANRGIIKKLK